MYIPIQLTNNQTLDIELTFCAYNQNSTGKVLYTPIIITSRKQRSCFKNIYMLLSQQTEQWKANRGGLTS